jgi:hypothetical protein
MAGLGWLTESAFLPKESKKIQIDSSSSLVTLKAQILEKKAQLNARQQSGDASKSAQSVAG